MCDVWLTFLGAPADPGAKIDQLGRPGEGAAAVSSSSDAIASFIRPVSLLSGSHDLRGGTWPPFGPALPIMRRSREVQTLFFSSIFWKKRRVCRALIEKSGLHRR